MGTSTVSGPFRSQNGFQQLVNGVWTPVGGGSGGIAATVTLGDSASAVYSGVPDNRYSNSFYSLSGSTAGTYIQLPAIEIGQSILVDSKAAAYDTNVWALKYPENVPGVDVWTFWGSTLGVSGAESTSTATARPYEDLEGGGPSTYWFLYSYRPQNFIVTRIPNIQITGFGTIALFMVQNPLFRLPVYSPSAVDIIFPDPTQFPISFPY
jgi:hypothetical protein